MLQLCVLLVRCAAPGILVNDGELLLMDIRQQVCGYFATPISRVVPLSAGMQQFRTNNPYETKFGYSSAVRKGPFIFVSGTTSIDPDSGELSYPGSAYDQAQAIFDEIVCAVVALGGTKSDIVRVRMFVARDEDTGQVGDALRDVLGGVGPAATMLVGARFVSSEMLVEIEADAVVLA